jgi:hypothetical protein
MQNATTTLLVSMLSLATDSRADPVTESSAAAGDE